MAKIASAWFTTSGVNNVARWFSREMPNSRAAVTAQGCVARPGTALSPAEVTAISALGTATKARFMRASHIGLLMMFPKHTNTKERAVFGARKRFGFANLRPFHILIFR